MPPSAGPDAGVSSRSTRAAARLRHSAEAEPGAFQRPLQHHRLIACSYLPIGDFVRSAPAPCREYWYDLQSDIGAQQAWQRSHSAEGLGGRASTCGCRQAPYWAPRRPLVSTQPSQPLRHQQQQNLTAQQQQQRQHRTAMCRQRILHCSHASARRRPRDCGDDSEPHRRRIVCVCARPARDGTRVRIPRTAMTREATTWRRRCSGASSTCRAACAGGGAVTPRSPTRGWRPSRRSRRRGGRGGRRRWQPRAIGSLTLRASRRVRRPMQGTLSSRGSCGARPAHRLWPTPPQAIRARRGLPLQAHRTRRQLRRRMAWPRPPSTRVAAPGRRMCSGASAPAGRVLLATCMRTSASHDCRSFLRISPMAAQTPTPPQHKPARWTRMPL